MYYSLDTIILFFSALSFNCVNLAWSIESGVRHSMLDLGFTSKNDINKHFWHIFSSLVSNPHVGFESQVCYSVIFLIR